MTPLSRTLITAGVSIFTLGTLMWIFTRDWEWFAGGAAIFFGTLLAGGILSVEVKHPPHSPQTYKDPSTKILPSPSPRQERKEGERENEKITQDPFDV